MLIGVISESIAGFDWFSSSDDRFNQFKLSKRGRVGVVKFLSDESS